MKERGPNSYTLRNVHEGYAEIMRDGQLLGIVTLEAGGIWKPRIATGLHVRGTGSTVDEAAQLLVDSYHGAK